MAKQKTTQTLDEIRDRLAGGDPGPSTGASSSPYAFGADGMHSVMGTAGAAGLAKERPPLNDLARMRRDPMIAFALHFTKAYLARSQWHIKSTDSRRAAFIDAALRRIWGRLVLQWGSALDFGYSAVVKNFERTSVDWTYANGDQELPVWDSAAPPVIWTPFTNLNPRTARPAFTASGAFNGINYAKPRPGFGDDPTPDVPLEWALWFTNEKDASFGSLYGYPRSGYAHRAWWSYHYRWSLADRAFEKWSDPPLVIYHPTETATDASGATIDRTAEALALAESLRSGANVALPSDVITNEIDGRMASVRAWDLKPMEVNVQFDALNEAFEYLDVYRFRACMVPEQAFFEGKGGTSSRNVAAEMGDAFEASQAVLLAEIFDQVNRYMIPQLLEANFGPGGASCEIVADGFDPADIETGRSLIQAATQNTPSRMGSVDFRETLKRLGIPLLSLAAAKEQEHQIIEETQRARPRNVNASADQVPIRNGVYGGSIETEAAYLADVYEPPAMTKHPERGGWLFGRNVKGGSK